MRLHPVSARTGLVWVREGIKTFWRQPLAMSGLFFLFMAVVSVVSVLPLVGTAVALALLPAATLGLMAASREASEGKFPMPTVLASAFRAGKERLNAMLQLGAFYAAGFLLVMGVSALFDGGQFAQMYLGGGNVTAETVQSSEFQTAMWVGMSLYLPLALLFWHAPALVHWHGVSPVKSLFFSFMACWQNKGAMLVYLLAWMGVFVLCGVLVSLAASMLGGGAMQVALFPAALLMAAMFFSSFYFTFRDSFTE
ncbi:BPSS1780 family membrane protein [Hydrogenophaga sp. OTU3427]|uniref:BPSS1780 family membrane protein n=1 Tax=Hydrogenophaga sp. OTU3427 TaxID=3043856 RepID=UPI00313BE5F9